MLADLERDLIDGVGKLAAYLGWAVTVYAEGVTGANPDLAGPLAMAYRRVVGSPATGTRPALAEYEAISPAVAGTLGDWALYLTLQKARDSLTDVDVSTLDASMKLSQLRDSLDARIRFLGDRLGDDGRQPLRPFSIPLANVATGLDAGECFG